MASRVYQASTQYLVTLQSQGVTTYQSSLQFLVRSFLVYELLKIDPPIKIPSPKMQLPPLLD